MNFYKKEKLENYFDYLESVKDSEVICIYWELGKMKGYKGKLKEIIPYKYIDIEGKIIEFVGVRTAIEYILFKEHTIIYANTDVRGYKGNLEDKRNLMKAQKRFLGYSVLEKEHKKIKVK